MEGIGVGSGGGIGVMEGIGVGSGGGIGVMEGIGVGSDGRYRGGEWRKV